MPDLDLAQLFGLPPQKPDPRVSLALLLRHLSELLDAGDEEGEAQMPAEIPVRPRVLPTGGG
jgi:hypothetical protein